MPSLQGLLKKITSRNALGHYFKKASKLRHYPIFKYFYNHVPLWLVLGHRIHNPEFTDDHRSTVNTIFTIIIQSKWNLK